MKYTSITVAFLAAFAAAKTIDELVESIPTCAITCIRDGAQSVNCAITDFQCSCGKVEQLTPTVVSCLSKSSCTAQDQTDVLLASQDICAQVAAGGSATGSIPVATGAAPTGTGTVPADAVSTTGTAAASTSTPAAAGRVQAAGWAGAVAVVAAFAL
ncbi:immunoreactive protein [Colletotrichum musicola]|uniref:Immunoreactive protein n=1 Tax=Colletotrichum musicola TaxID=2175873 RepID=A0A8H6N3U0_9PEZI|nr:immunoreactive protein [Colletotrichum musicola]